MTTHKFERPTPEESAWVADVNRLLAAAGYVHAFSTELPDGSREYRVTVSAGGRRRTYRAGHPFYHKSPAAFVKLIEQWVGTGARDPYSTDEAYAEVE